MPINSLETDADKARWGLILRAAREHVEADAVAVLYPAWTTIRHKNPEMAPDSDSEHADADADAADNSPIDTLFVQLHTRDHVYWRGFEQIRDPKHQRIVAFAESRRCPPTTNGTKPRRLRPGSAPCSSHCPMKARNLTSIGNWLIFLKNRKSAQPFTPES